MARTVVYGIFCFAPDDAYTSPTLIEVHTDLERAKEVADRMEREDNATNEAPSDYSYFVEDVFLVTE